MTQKISTWAACRKIPHSFCTNLIKYPIYQILHSSQAASPKHYPKAHTHYTVHCLSLTWEEMLGLKRDLTIHQAENIQHQHGTCTPLGFQNTKNDKTNMLKAIRHELQTSVSLLAKNSPYPLPKEDGVICWEQVTRDQLPYRSWNEKGAGLATSSQSLPAAASGRHWPVDTLGKKQRQIRWDTNTEKKPIQEGQ